MKDTILIADDDTELVKMLRTFFELRNYTVITASDGAETLKMVERKPDLILLDINMPKADGIEVCRRIRDKVSCPNSGLKSGAILLLRNWTRRY